MSNYERFDMVSNSDNELEILDREGIFNITTGYQAVQMMNKLVNLVHDLKAENVELKKLLKKQR